MILNRSQQASFSSGDIVFSTGGIGATPDDHTRQCTALALGTKELHPGAQKLIAGRIQSMAKGAPIKADLNTPENRHRFKTGEFPIGSDIIPKSI